MGSVPQSWAHAALVQGIFQINIFNPDVWRCLAARHVAGRIGGVQ